MTNLSFIAVIVFSVFLGLELHRRLGLSRIAKFKAARRSTSRLVGSGQLVVGAGRRAVGLAVTESTLFYERSGLKASIDLERVLAIEYDTALASGVDVRDGRVLRMRAPGGTIEFVLPREDVSNWYLILPPHPEREGLAAGARTALATAPPAAPLVWLR